jgi:ABC-type antimicrobial peptide transport system permease subunit
MVLKNLFRRKLRNLLTALGIGVGVAAIIGLGALAQGLNSGYSSMMSSSQADLVLSQPDTMDVTYSAVDEEIGPQLLAMPEVKAVSGMLESYSQAESSPFFFLFGYPEDSFILKRFQVIDGVGLDSREARQAHGTPILLGSASAESFKKKVADTIVVNGRPFRVVGIYQTGDAFEDGGSVLGLADAQALLGKTHRVSLFYIQLKNASLRDQVTKRAERLWPDLEVSGTEDFADKQIMGDMMQGYVWAIAALAIVIGGVGMMNAQLTSVMERTREIGVLRAVGWSSWRVMWMIVSESILVSLLGGLVGTALGWLMISGLSTLVNWANTKTLTLEIYGQAFGTVLVLGLVGGLYPAWRASRLQPVEALRYEGSTSGKKVRRLPVGGMPVQSLWQRMARTMLTLGVIGFTVGGIISLDAIMRGTSEVMTQMATGSDVEIMIRQANISDTSLSAIDERIGEKISALPEVENTSSLIFTAIMTPGEGGNSTGFFILQGYAPNEYAIRRFKMLSGTRLTANHQIILGRTMAEGMKKGAGDTIILGNTRFRVVGIYETGTGWEELGGVMTLRDAQTFTGNPRKVTMIGVKLRDLTQAEAVVKEINTKFPDVHAALAGEFAEQMPDMANGKGMIGGISFLAIAVGGVGVLNTMLMSVLERTREIGVLRAMGWKRRAVLGLILRESLLLGLSGGISGVIVAFLLVALIQLTPMIGEAFKVIWEWDIFVRAFAISIALGVLGGLYPAYRATRLQPIEALRYE